MYGLPGFEDNLNILNCVNSMRNCVHQMYKFSGFTKKIEHLELRRSDGKLCTLDVQIVWICKNIEYPELRKFNKKLCTL